MQKWLYRAVIFLILAYPVHNELCAYSRERAGDTARNEQRRKIYQHGKCLHDRDSRDHLPDIVEDCARDAAKPDISLANGAAERQHSRKAEQTSAKAE